MKKMFYYILLAGMLFFSCGSKGTVTLGSLNTPDALIVSEIYAGALEKAGYKVVRSFGFDRIEALHAAVVSGEIGIGTEWTGAALTKALQAPRAGDQYGVYDALNRRCQEIGLALLEPLPADNHWTLVVLQAAADSRGLKTFSDIKNIATELSIAVTDEFNNDNEGFPLLDEIYGPFSFKEIKVVSEEEQHNLLRNNTVAVIALRSNDGHFADDAYKALRDNFHAFVPQNLVPVAKNELLDAYIGIRPALNAVSASLNDRVMILLNNKVSIQKTPYARAAKEYLKEKL